MSTGTKDALVQRVSIHVVEIAAAYEQAKASKLAGAQLVAVFLDLATHNGRVAFDVLAQREGAALDQLTGDAATVSVAVMPRHTASKLAMAMNDGVALKLPTGEGIPVVAVGEGVVLTLLLQQPK